MESEVPEDDAGTDRHIKGVLCAELRNLQTEISRIYNILAHAGHFIAEDYGILSSLLRDEAVQHDGSGGLLGTDHGIAILLQTADRIQGIVEMFPLNAVFRPESRLVDLGRRRYGAYSAKEDLVDLERIRCAEYGSYIMGAPDIVKHDNKA